MIHPDKKPDKNRNEKEKSPTSKKERKIDEQVEESFPASDTPSHVQPGSGRKKKK